MLSAFDMERRRVCMKSVFLPVLLVVALAYQSGCEEQPGSREEAAHEAPRVEKPESLAVTLPEPSPDATPFGIQEPSQEGYSRDRPHKSLAELQARYSAGEIYIEAWFSAMSPGEFTVVATKTRDEVFLEDGNIAGYRPSYNSDIEVFDSDGELADGSYGFDRMESVNNWRPDGSMQSLIRVATLLDGEYFFTIDEAGNLQQELWLTDFRISMNDHLLNHRLFIVAGKQITLDANQFVAVVPAVAGPQAQFRSSGGFVYLQDCTVGNLGPVTDVSDGYFEILFGPGRDATVQYFAEYDLAKIYSIVEYQ
jgi:hypothetical protein